MILWTASSSGSHNTSLPSTAPMKRNSLQAMTFENRWRRAVLFFTLLSLICLTVSSRSAQSKNPKRVTALQVGAAAEGSRVTIVSDSALNDYEAFRRGDRFYVRIPLANFTAAPPSFRSNGFDDVRVQEIGQDVVVSFKLQPGASARVDQHSNRLEVVFSAFRSSRTVTAGNSYPTTRDRRKTGDADAIAGPMPPNSSSSSSQRYPVTGRAGVSGSSRQNSPGSLVPAPRNNSSTRRNMSESGPVASTPRGTGSTRRSATETASDPNRKSTSPAEKLPSKSTPSATPSTLSTPSTSSTGATGAASPMATPTPFASPTVSATPYVQKPASAPVASTTRPPGTSWESRVSFLKAWARLNRNALIGGGLIALALLIGVVLWSRLKGQKVKGKASRKTSGKPVSEKAMPKHAHRDADPEREVFEL